MQTLYFSSEFMRKNQRPNQVNDPWYIPAVPTGKSDFAEEGQTPFVWFNRRQQHWKGAKCRHYFQMDLHYYCGFSCHPSEQQEHPRNSLSSRGPCYGYFLATLQQGRPIGSDEGRKVVQWRNLHVLLPQRPLPTS